MADSLHRGFPSDQGLFAWLAAAAGEDGNRDVLVGIKDGKSVPMSISQLKSDSLCLASGLLSIGVEERSTIAIWLPNQIEWVVSQFACSAIGAVVLGLNTRYRVSEISHLLATVSVDAIVLPSNFLGIDFVGILNDAVTYCRERNASFEVPSLIFLEDVPESATSLVTSKYRYEDLVSMNAMTDWRDHASALSNLFTTSGSTSAPKLGGHDQASIMRHARADADALGVRRGDSILAILPLCGVFGFSSMMALICGGGIAVLMQSFNPEEAAGLLKNLGITHVVGGDDMLSRLFCDVLPGVTLPLLRRGGITDFVGSARAVVELADQRWGAKISGVYGSSELFALTAIWPENSSLATRCLQGGLVVDPGIEFRVVDQKTLKPQPLGDSGELQFRGYNVIDCYLNNREATQNAFTEDGWFRSGDLGYAANGGFVFQCRASDALRLHGFLVEPAEIEKYISRDNSIEEVHVVGVETESGMKTIAFVKCRPGCVVDEAVVLEDAKRNLAGYKVPVRVIEIKEFPTTTGVNGTKIRFNELREYGKKVLLGIDTGLA